VTEASPTHHADRTLTIAGIAVTAAVLYLHLRAYVQAGALWRDEVNSLNVANAPSFGELWRLLQFESFPLLWPAVLRGWSGLGFGAHDADVRLICLIVGVLACVVFWFAAIVCRARVPVFMLALFAMHPLVLRWGDSLRGYGLGAVTVVFSLGAMWRMTDRPTRANVAIAAVAAVLCVQAVYYNAFFVAAMVLGIWAASFPGRQWGTALKATAIGALAAVTMLPYLGVIRQVGAWSMLVKTDVSASAIWETFSLGLSAASPWTAAVWIVLFVVSIGLAFTRIAAPCARFACVVMVAGVLLFVGVLMRLDYPISPPYYIVAMAFVACCFDMIIGGTLERVRHGRWIMFAALVLLTVGTSSSAWRYSAARFTNVDEVADGLREESGAGDLIIVTRWTIGIPFDRYYHGAASWMTLPPLADHRVHRFDLVRQAIESDGPLHDVHERIKATLRAGGRVILVRREPPVDGGSVAKPGGLLMQPHLDWYIAQVDQFLAEHAATFEHFSIRDDPAVLSTEKLTTITIANGWRKKQDAP